MKAIIAGFIGLTLFGQATATEIENQGWVFELPKEEVQKSGAPKARSHQSGKRSEPVLLPGTKVVEKQRGQTGTIGNSLILKVKGDISANIGGNVTVSDIGEGVMLLIYPDDTDMWAEKQRLERLDDVLIVEIDVITERYQPQ